MNRRTRKLTVDHFGDERRGAGRDGGSAKITHTEDVKADFEQLHRRDERQARNHGELLRSLRRSLAPPAGLADPAEPPSTNELLQKSAVMPSDFVLHGHRRHKSGRSSSTMAQTKTRPSNIRAAVATAQASPTAPTIIPTGHDDLENEQGRGDGVPGGRRRPACPGKAVAASRLARASLRRRRPTRWHPGPARPWQG